MTSEEHFPEPLPDFEEEHRASDEEAAAMDTEHPGPADPPRDGKFLVESAVRSESPEGVATHVERINPPQPAAPRVIDHAHAEHPDGVRWPYMIGRLCFHDNRIKQPGEIVMLLPHEVAAHHRLIDRERFAEFGVE